MEWVTFNLTENSVHLSPAWCQHLYRLGAWGRSAHIYPSSLFLPITPLPHEDLDWSSRREGLLSPIPPIQEIALKEERKREGQNKWMRTQNREDKHSPRGSGNQRKNQLLLTFLPFTKKTNSSAVIVNRLGSPNSRYLRLRGTASYHCPATWQIHLSQKRNEVSQWEGPSLELWGTESS